MEQSVISINGIGKRYRLGAMQGIISYKTLRDLIANIANTPVRLRTDHKNGAASGSEKSRYFWALKDISFNVRQGEVIGVIGKNGAGKTTLLKILSQITEPTEGEVRIRGRVSSLLEVGTGFHPELTGRENIFMNGAILGMARSETLKKFDEIIAFAELENFIDTPVKRYSSGMYVRLAFAVAAHLEPEILLVDEVLAVGDAAFQKKCLGKMGQVTKEGRTVFFVSHNMAAVQSLCDRVIWLNGGKIQKEGKAAEIVSSYLNSSAATITEQSWDDMETSPGNDKVRLRRLWVKPEGNSPSDQITMRTPLVIGIEYWNKVEGAHLDITLLISTAQGVIAFGSSTVGETTRHDRPLPSGLFQSVCRIPGDLLNSGAHWVELLVVKDQNTVIYRNDELLSFNVIDSLEGRGAYYGKRAGVVRPKLDWTTKRVGAMPGTPDSDNR